VPCVVVPVLPSLPQADKATVTATRHVVCIASHRVVVRIDSS